MEKMRGQGNIRGKRKKEMRELVSFGRFVTWRKENALM
jgi:hypothetical protein